MKPFIIGKMIRSTENNVRNYINKELEEFNISDGQFQYFIIISDNEGINQNELANLMNVGKTSVTKAIKILLSEGIIDRQIDINDKRNYGLYISSKGKSYLSIFNKIATNINNVVFNEFDEDELKVLKKLLSKMCENSKLF